MLTGHSISTDLPEELGLGERFWYWLGASGQSYIHSIYTGDNCPPVPGAVYVLVRKRDGGREALEVGRFGTKTTFPPVWSTAPDVEVHLHLLARCDAAAEQVLADLKVAFRVEPRPAFELAGFSEPRQLELVAA